jgi:hypothetical protein
MNTRLVSVSGCITPKSISEMPGTVCILYSFIHSLLCIYLKNLIKVCTGHEMYASFFSTKFIQNFLTPINIE